MKHSSTYYFVQSKAENEDAKIVGHSTDDETGEVYYKFIDRSKATKLLKDEKKVAPELKYRIVKQTESLETSSWE